MFGACPEGLGACVVGPLLLSPPPPPPPLLVLVPLWFTVSVTTDEPLVALVLVLLELPLPTVPFPVVLEEL